MREDDRRPRSLLRLIEPTSGEVLYNGANLLALSPPRCDGIAAISRSSSRIHTARSNRA